MPDPHIWCTIRLDETTDLGGQVVIITQFYTFTLPYEMQIRRSRFGVQTETPFQEVRPQYNNMDTYFTGNDKLQIPTKFL